MWENFLEKLLKMHASDNTRQILFWIDIQSRFCKKLIIFMMDKKF